MNIWLQRILTFVFTTSISLFLARIMPNQFLSQTVFFFTFTLGIIGTWNMTDQFWPSTYQWFKDLFK